MGPSTWRGAGRAGDGAGRGARLAASFAALALLLSLSVLSNAKEADSEIRWLVVLEEGAPRSTLPHLATTMAEHRLAELLFDRFFFQAPDGEVESRVFEEERKYGRPHLDLELIDGLRFSDGTPVEFADVVFSVNRLFRSEESGYPGAFWYSKVFGQASQETETRGSLEFRVEWESMEDTAPRFLTTTSLISERSATRTGGALDLDARRPVGTGPFAAVDPIDDLSDIRLVRNPHHAHWVTSSPDREFVQGVRLLYGLDAAEKQRMMLAGEAHVWISPPPGVLPRFRGERDRFGVRTYDVQQWWNIAVDHTHDALRDPRVREALDLLLPRHRLVEMLGADSVDPTAGLFSPGSAWESRTHVPTPNSPERAATLLESAGFERVEGRWMRGGAPLRLVLGVQAEIAADFRPVVDAIVGAWSDSGIALEWSTIGLDEWADVIEAGGASQRYDLVLATWSYRREEDLLAVVLRPRPRGRQLNIFGWVDDQPGTEEDVEGYWAAFNVETSGPAREQLMIRLDERVHKLRPVLSLWVLKSQSIYRRDLLSGFRASDFYYFNRISRLSWKPRPSEPK